MQGTKPWKENESSQSNILIFRCTKARLLWRCLNKCFPETYHETWLKQATRTTFASNKHVGGCGKCPTLGAVMLKNPSFFGVQRTFWEVKWRLGQETMNRSKWWKLVFNLLLINKMLIAVGSNFFKTCTLYVILMVKYTHLSGAADGSWSSQQCTVGKKVTR